MPFAYNYIEFGTDIADADLLEMGWHLDSGCRHREAAQIDSQDPFNKYGAHASEICESKLPFYPGARLLRVTNRTPAVGSRYFIQRGGDLVPLHRLPEVQSFCDDHFGLAQDSKTAADHFRFAHYFSSEGERTSLVEGPQDLRIDPSSSSPENQQAIAFIKPLEITADKTAQLMDS